MSQAVPLSSRLGEMMAPQTLMVALVVSPQGTVSVDPGALHGRSALEQGLQFVRERGEAPGAVEHWFVWAAVEVEPNGQPVRCKGLTASEIWVDTAARLGYKILATHVNRISDALAGKVHVAPLNQKARAAVRGQLEALGLWERTPQVIQRALA